MFAYKIQYNNENDGINDEYEMWWRCEPRKALGANGNEKDDENMVLARKS